MQDSLMCHVEEGKIEDQYFDPDLGTREDSDNKNRITKMAREYYINELTQPFGVSTHNDLHILSNSQSKEEEYDYR